MSPRCFLSVGLFFLPLQAQTPLRWEINNLTSIGGNATTLVGAPVLITTPSGQATQFDGVRDGMIVNANPLAGALEFTVEVVFNPYSGGATEQRFVHMEQNDSNRILIELRSNADKTFYLDTFIKSGASSLTLVSTALVHPSDKWHHAALTYKNRVMTHFVDGVQELTGAVTFVPVTSGQTSVGMRLNRVAFYKGAIKTVKVTQQALAPAQFITAEANTLNGSSSVKSRAVKNSLLNYCAWKELEGTLKLFDLTGAEVSSTDYSHARIRFSLIRSSRSFSVLPLE